MSDTPILMSACVAFRIKTGRADKLGMGCAERGQVGTPFQREDLGGWANRRAWVLVFLLAFGAILTFAVDWKVAGLDLHAVGWVLMAAGAVGLVLFFYFWNRRRVPVAVPQQPQMREPLTREPLLPGGQVYDSRQNDAPDCRQRRERRRPLLTR